MKRIKRKQLKKDELVTTVNKIVRFAKKRAKEMIAFGVLILFSFLIFTGVRFIKLQNTKKESRLLGQILKLHSELDDHPENVARLEELSGSGKFSRLAYLLLANYWVEKGEFNKAEDFLQKLSEGKKDIFYYQAQDLLAQIHIIRENYDKAIDIYKKIEEEKPKEYVLDAVLFHRAEAHQEKGEIEEALALYKRVQDEFPQTYFGFDASQKVGKLEGKK